MQLLRMVLKTFRLVLQVRKQEVSAFSDTLIKQQLFQSVQQLQALCRQAQRHMLIALIAFLIKA